MDLVHIEDNWKPLKGNIQQQWVKLTRNDLDIANSKPERLAGNPQQSMQSGIRDASDGNGEPGNSESDEMDDSGKHTTLPAPKPMPNPIPDEMGVFGITKK